MSDPIPARSRPCAAGPPAAIRPEERGVALILTIFLMIVIAGLVTSGALVLRSHQAQTKLNFVAHGQSMQFARSGLIEALGWLRKQTAQPVTAFEPRLDLLAVPPRLDTIDPEVGIVREFQITESVWGRYEVWKQWAGDPDPVRLAWRQQMANEDISSSRGNLSPGSVWRVRSLGYVYRRVDPDVPFDQAPNQVIGQEMAEVEARRLALQPPGQAALCSRSAADVRVLTRGRVLGGSVAAGLYHLNGTGSPTVSGTSATLTGAPNQSAALGYDDSFEAVFGVSRDELTAMADYVVPALADFPNPVPMDTVVVASAPMAFTAAKPLKGTGVVVVLGDTTIGQGSYSSFSGLLYVQGNLTLREPCEIQGAVVATGSVRVEGNSDFATITYDDSILQHLRQQLGTYRLSSAISLPLTKER
jgi:hypothetical protein